MPAKLSLILCAWFLSAAAWAAPMEDVYQRAFALAKAKDFAAAEPLMRRAAEAGHPGAQTALAEFYSFGLGVPQSKEQARSWYERAAALGDAYALYSIGLYWDRGIGGPQDRVRALDFYRRGASAGDDRAAYNAGQLLMIGDGVTANPAEGVRLIEVSAAKGNAIAHSSLGYIYETGFGVRKNARAALDHYARAEKAGHAVAGQRRDFLAATVLSEGEALERDRHGPAAFEMLELSCHYGHFYACQRAGSMLMTGELVRKDTTAAMVQFRKGCNSEATTACSALGDAVIQGAPATADDIAKTRRVAESRCGQGHANACHILAAMKQQPRFNMLDPQGAMNLLAQNCLKKGFQPSCQPYFDMYNASLPQSSGSGSSGGGMTWLEQGIIDVLGIAAGTMSAMGSASRAPSGSYAGYSSYSPPAMSYSSPSGGYSPQDRADFNQFISSVSAYGQNVKCRAGNPYC
jgi:TPR repeat protein